jgi:hypothetical protein
MNFYFKKTMTTMTTLSLAVVACAGAPDGAPTPAPAPSALAAADLVAGVTETKAAEADPEGAAIGQDFRSAYPDFDPASPVAIADDSYATVESNNYTGIWVPSSAEAKRWTGITGWKINVYDAGGKGVNETIVYGYINKTLVLIYRPNYQNFHESVRRENEFGSIDFNNHHGSFDESVVGSRLTGLVKLNNYFIPTLKVLRHDMDLAERKSIRAYPVNWRQVTGCLFGVISVVGASVAVLTVCLPATAGSAGVATLPCVAAAVSVVGAAGGLAVACAP